MKEEVRIIVLSAEEHEWLKEQAECGMIGRQGTFREMIDDYMLENIELAIKQYKKAYINENFEVTLTIRFM